MEPARFLCYIENGPHGLFVSEKDGQVAIGVGDLEYEEITLTDGQAAVLEAVLCRRRHALPFKNVNQEEN